MTASIISPGVLKMLWHPFRTWRECALGTTAGDDAMGNRVLAAIVEIEVGGARLTASRESASKVTCYATLNSVGWKGGTGRHTAHIDVSNVESLT